MKVCDEKQIIKMTETVPTIFRYTPEEIKIILNMFDQNHINMTDIDSFVLQKDIDEIINNENYFLETLPENMRDLLYVLDK